MTTVAQTMTSIESRSPEEVNRAYLEYRQACYAIVFKNCRDKGVLEILRHPVTHAEFCAKMGVVDSKTEIAQLLLNALVKYGAVARIEDAEARYRVTSMNFEAPVLDADLLEIATTKRSFEELLHSESYAGIIDALRSDDNPVSATFDAEHQALWDEVLQAPFYRYSRVAAVEEIALAGPRLVDLACGPGFGIAELVERRGDNPDSLFAGVEISPDFVGAATQRNAAHPDVHIMRGDLERPVDYLAEGLFDGAMIVGAYHFLQDKTPLWRSARRLLRPGGTFCVSYALSQVGTYDQEIMDLRFALRQPPSYQPTRDEVLALAEEHQMTLNREFNLGAWCWYSFRKA